MAGSYLLVVLVALGSTLHSLATEDFDGLNDALLMLVTLPWAVVLVPLGGAVPVLGRALGDNVVFAWALAAGSVVNAIGAYWLVLGARRPAGG